MNSDLVELWLKHCKAAGHTTQAEAFDQGKKPNRAKYATFNLSPSGNRIYCGLKGCEWTGRSESAEREEVYQEHIEHEGEGTGNAHPDGCFYCGSSLHHSQDCPEREV